MIISATFIFSRVSLSHWLKIAEIPNNKIIINIIKSKYILFFLSSIIKNYTSYSNNFITSFIIFFESGIKKSSRGFEYGTGVYKPISLEIGQSR